MAFDSVPFIMDGTTLDGEVIRRALGTLLSAAGGIVTPGDLAVAQQTVPNMSVQIAAGQAWIPGTSTASQGAYYTRNGAAVTAAISAADVSNPRIDTVIVQVEDAAYAGVNKDCVPAVVAGTPTPGATLVNLSGKGAVPASSLVLAYVLVPTSAVSIVTADIANVAAQASTWASRGAVNIATSESRTNVAYGTLATADQVTGIVLPTNGLIEVTYHATWQESVNGAASAAIFVGSNQLKAASNAGVNPEVQAAVTASGGTSTNYPLSSSPIGLVSGKSGYSGTDATTGQVVGVQAASGITYGLGSGVFTTTAPIFSGGPCYIFAAAGTYTVSVQFKSTSGSVTAAGRKLWVRAIAFS